MKTPKDFIGKHMGSILQKAEPEWVWNNILKILNRTGNTWRALTWDEYVIERKKDTGFNNVEKPYFEQVLRYTSCAETAALFSPQAKEVMDGIDIMLMEEPPIEPEKTYTQSDLENFGRECFEAGRKHEKAGFEFKYKTFNDYLTTKTATK